jgi:hypothetical protein
MDDILESFSVASKEDGAGSRSVADTNNVALKKWRPVRRRGEWLVVSAVAGGFVGNRSFVET